MPTRYFARCMGIHQVGSFVSNPRFLAMFQIDKLIKHNPYVHTRCQKKNICEGNVNILLINWPFIFRSQQKFVRSN